MQRLKAILKHCQGMEISSSEAVLKLSANEMLANRDPLERIMEDEEENFAPLPSPEPGRGAPSRGRTDYGGLLLATEGVQQCFEYLGLTLKAIQIVY